MQPKPITAELAATFNKLADQWEKETALDSFRAIKIRHPAFRQVVEMGEDALPLIFRRMEQKVGHWWWALEIITGIPSVEGIYPVSGGPWVKIDVMEVNAAWLQWGRDQGYRW